MCKFHVLGVSIYLLEYVRLSIYINLKNNEIIILYTKSIINSIFITQWANGRIYF